MKSRFEEYIHKNLLRKINPESFPYVFNPKEYIVPKVKLREILLLMDKYKINTYKVLKNSSDENTFKVQYLACYEPNDKVAYNIEMDILISISKILGSNKKRYIANNVQWIDEIYKSIGFCRSFIIVQSKDIDQIRKVFNSYLKAELNIIDCDEEFTCFQLPGAIRRYRVKETEITSYLSRGNISFCAIEDIDGSFEVWKVREFGTRFKSKVSYREEFDLILNSTWEANLARILKYKKIPFIYEEKKFLLKDGDSNLTYIPDFFLSNNTIIEVKGFWDNESLKKVSLFKEQFPEYRLKIIDGDMFNDLSNLYKGDIQNWEQCNLNVSSSSVYIVGIQREERRKAVSELQMGDEICLKREPENSFDKNAIAAYNTKGEQIGYIRKDYASIYADKMDVGFEYLATLSKIDKSSLTVKVVRNNINEIIIYDFLK